MTEVYGYSRSNSSRELIDIQNEQIINFASVKNLKVRKIYTDINSGTKIGKQLSRLIDEIPNNSTLLVRDRTRISHNSMDYMLIHRELVKKNIKIIYTRTLK